MYNFFLFKCGFSIAPYLIHKVKHRSWFALGMIELVDLDELEVFRKFIPLIRSSLTGECCFCYLFVDLVGPGEQYLQTRISAIVMESTGGSVA